MGLGRAGTGNYRHEGKRDKSSGRTGRACPMDDTRHRHDGRLRFAVKIPGYGRGDSRWARDMCRLSSYCS